MSNDIQNIRNSKQWVPIDFNKSVNKNEKIYYECIYDYPIKQQTS